MKVKGEFSINRTHGNREFPVKITVVDADARIKVLTVNLDLEEMMEALFAKHGVDCEIEVPDGAWERIGKMKERSEKIYDITHLNTFDRKEIRRYLANNVPDGWEAILSLSSQNSTFSKDGKDFARVPLSRWVEKVDENLDES